MKKLMVTLVELHDHMWRLEKPTEEQTSLQHSTDLGFMAKHNPHLSEDTCIKAPKGPSEKPDSLV